MGPHHDYQKKFHIQKGLFLKMQMDNLKLGFYLVLKLYKFLLKKYIPVYRAGDKICIGYVNDLEKYIEIDYTNYNISLVNNLLRDGITKKEIKSIYLYSAFFDSKFSG